MIFSQTKKNVNELGGAGLQEKKNFFHHIFGDKDATTRNRNMLTT